MAKVIYLMNGEKTALEVPVGESLAGFGIDNGLDIKHACGFNCRCTTCACKIKAGTSFISQKMEHEQERLEMKAVRGDVRLSCQCIVVKDGEIEVEFESVASEKKEEEGDTVFK